MKSLPSLKATTTAKVEVKISKENGKGAFIGKDIEEGHYLKDSKSNSVEFCISVFFI
jgi:hypothetical protein